MLAAYPPSSEVPLNGIFKPNGQSKPLNPTADTFARPGHVVPLRARPRGVLERKGHTEAALGCCICSYIQ